MIISEIRDDRANKSFRLIKESVGEKKSSYVATHIVWPPYSVAALATKERVNRD